MISAGIDIGSTACKAVVLSADEEPVRIAGYSIGPSTSNPGKTSMDIFERAVHLAGYSTGEVTRVVGTGYGRALVSFADDNISELTCHGRGAVFINPKTRTVLDIGGQDTKAIRIDEDGFLADYSMNDKCAAGTGRFLEAMARTLGLSFEEMDDLSIEANHAAAITSMCSVFAESEVINLINDGVRTGAIVKGLHEAMAGRVASLAQRVGLEPDILVTGGVAKSRGVIDAVSAKIGIRPWSFPAGFDPQITGALGAAVCAMEQAREGSG